MRQYVLALVKRRVGGYSTPDFPPKPHLQARGLSTHWHIVWLLRTQVKTSNRTLSRHRRSPNLETWIYQRPKPLSGKRGSR